MLSLPDLTIFDVGHGNCAVLHDDNDDQVVVIDVPLGDTELKSWLTLRGLQTIEAILVSHADEDHIGGVLSVLTDPEIIVHRLYLNSESQRGTKIWEDLRFAIKDARCRGQGPRVHVELTTENSADFALTTVELEILAPSPELAMSGASGKTPRGRSLTANTMSAVIRVSHPSARGVIFMGDIDGVGLQELLDDSPDLVASALVFPHHGGRPGSTNMRTFAEAIATHVQPDVVVFSLGRGEHATPQPEIVDGVRGVCPSVHVACTQLSERCAAALPGIAQPYLSSDAGRGHPVGAACAGTLNIELTPQGLMNSQVAGHGRFVDQLPQPVCRRALAGPAAPPPATPSAGTGR